MSEKVATKLTKHGDLRIDNYYWLKDNTNEKVLNHLKLENDYSKAMMKDTLELQEKLYTEMKSTYFRKIICDSPRWITSSYLFCL